MQLEVIPWIIFSSFFFFPSLKVRSLSLSSSQQEWECAGRWQLSLTSLAAGTSKMLDHSLWTYFLRLVPFKQLQIINANTVINTQHLKRVPESLNIGVRCRVQPQSCAQLHLLPRLNYMTLIMLWFLFFPQLHFSSSIFLSIAPSLQQLGLGCWTLWSLSPLNRKAHKYIQSTLPAGALNQSIHARPGNAEL